MLIAGLLLGGFLVFVMSCLLIAARRGLWLKVELDVHQRRTTTVVHQHTHHHRLAHHHYLYADLDYPVDGELTARVLESRVLPRAVLPRYTARAVGGQVTARKELEP